MDDPALRGTGLDRRTFLRATSGILPAGHLPGGVAPPGARPASHPPSHPAGAPPAPAPPTSSGLLFREWLRNPHDHPLVPDVSYAGYRRGETPLPVRRVAARVTAFGGRGDGRTDNTAALRRAIDAAAARGGGAVLLPPGEFRVDGFVWLNRSGVVLRGAGRSRTRIVFTRSLNQVLGELRYDGQSQWSYAGGLVWIAPGDSFDRHGRLLSWDGRPVDPAGTVPNDWEQWRGGGFHQGHRLAKVTRDARRGARVLTVDTTAGLRPGQFVLMTWRNAGAAGGYSLLKHLAGSPLLADAYDWRSAGWMLPPDLPCYRWPVQVLGVRGRTVCLAQPVRLDVRAGEWDVDLQQIGPYVRECGVEHLTLALRGPTHPAETHLQQYGANGVYLNRAVDCWVREVDVDGGENGLVVSQCKQVTASGFAVRSPVKVHHGTACRFMSADVLHEDFVLDPARIFHGINHEWLSSGIVWSRGRLVHGTFDSHRGLPFDNVRAEVLLDRNDGAAGGSGLAGPRNGRRVVGWNVDNRGPTGTGVNQPESLSSGALVGVRGPRDDRCDRATVCGDKGTRSYDEGKVPQPVNLYEAQLAARLRC
jgi:Pectate lyase superfamily protein